MGLRLKERICELPEYNDGRVFDWIDYSHYMTLGDYTIICRYGNIWNAFHKMTESDSKRLAIGTKEFCMKCVEHEIRQDEMDKV